MICRLFSDYFRKNNRAQNSFVLGVAELDDFLGFVWHAGQGRLIFQGQGLQALEIDTKW